MGETSQWLPTVGIQRTDLSEDEKVRLSFVGEVGLDTGKGESIRSGKPHE